MPLQPDNWKNCAEGISLSLCTLLFSLEYSFYQKGNQRENLVDFLTALSTLVRVKVVLF